MTFRYQYSKAVCFYKRRFHKLAISSFISVDVDCLQRLYSVSCFLCQHHASNQTRPKRSPALLVWIAQQKYNIINLSNSTVCMYDWYVAASCTVNYTRLLLLYLRRFGWIIKSGDGFIRDYTSVLNLKLFWLRGWRIVSDVRFIVFDYSLRFTCLL